MTPPSPDAASTINTLRTDLAAERSRAHMLAGIAHGNDLCWASSSATTIDLLAEVSRLQGLVAALWRGGEAMVMGKP